MINPPIDSHIIDDILARATHATSLILCLTAPPIPNPSGVSGKVFKLIYGKEDVWSTDNLVLLYDALFKWLQKDGSRKVQVITGDIHIGLHAKVHLGTRSFDIWSTGPITNHPTLMEHIYARSLLGSHQVDNYTVEVLEAHPKRNYIVVDLSQSQVQIKCSPKNTPASPWNLVKTFFTLKGIGVGEIRV